MGFFFLVHPIERIIIIYTPDGNCPWKNTKERMIYLLDGIFSWFHPKERIIYTPDGIFSWNHSEERIIMLLQYTLYQKQHNVTWASMFFWAIAPSLASYSPFRSILLHRAFSLSYWFSDRLLHISCAQIMCAVWVVFEFFCRKHGRRLLETLQMFGEKGNFCHLFFFFSNEELSKTD